MAKISDDTTLTLHQAKFLEKTPGNGVTSLVEFPKWVKFTETNLQNYVLGDLHVVLCTMRCAHGSNYKILSEWDAGPTYVVQRHGIPVDQPTPLDQAFILI